MFKFLLIFLLVFLVIRMFSRMMFSSYVYTDDRNQKEQRKSSKEGSVTLEKNPKPEKRFGKNEGEYVDYEEVK